MCLSNFRSVNRKCATEQIVRIRLISADISKTLTVWLLDRTLECWRRCVYRSRVDTHHFLRIRWFIVLYVSTTVSQSFRIVFICRLTFQIYLQARMTWRGSKLLKHFIQFVLVLLSWYTCMTRISGNWFSYLKTAKEFYGLIVSISDYKHHWSDVLAGATLGTFCALIVVSNTSTRTTLKGIFC